MEAATKRYVDAHSGDDPGKYVIEGYVRSGSGSLDIPTFPLDKIIPGLKTAEAFGSQAFVNGSAVAWPFIVSIAYTVTAVTIEHSATVTPGAKARLGIYTNASRTRLFPLSLVADISEWDLSTATGFKALTASVPLTVGSLYWAVYLTNSSGPTLRSVPGTGFFGWGTIPSTPPVLSAFNSLSANITYGALPSTFPSGTGPSVAGRNGPMPLVFFSITA